MRTTLIALGLGAVVARGWDRWLLTSVLMLWPALGGHFVELFFLNWLRPRLTAARGVQVAARIAVWLAGGSLLTLGMGQTAMALGAWMRAPAWWIGGIGFVGIELVAHLAMQLRGRPNFYDGRG